MHGAPDDVPKALVARTVKGRGVSFMQPSGETYRWHAGAPDDEHFELAHAELVARIRERLPDLQLVPVEQLEGAVSVSGPPGTAVAVIFHEQTANSRRPS